MRRRSRGVQLEAADLFCGGGGTSEALAQVCKAMGIEKVRLLAINHWKKALETHKANHPWAEHYNCPIENVDPRKVVPSGRLDLLVASPECTNHSVARGGRPINDQSRATAWAVLKWAQELYIDRLVLENVREWRRWGPIGADGKPLRSRMGETYQAFLTALRSLGYTLEEKILNAADFGAATTRERLFIMAKRGPGKKITWPEQTHTNKQLDDLFKGKMRKWRGAKTIIDWSIPGRSIFNRKRPLSESTIDRIVTGIRKFAGPAFDPFLVSMFGTGKARSIHRPAPTVTAKGQHIGLCQPFILSHKVFKHDCVDSIERPMRTITTTARDMKIVQPFIVPFFGERPGKKKKDGKKGKAQTPRTHSIEDPLPTPTSHGSGGVAIPFVIHIDHSSGKGTARSVNDPMGTLVTKENAALVTPFIISAGGPKLNKARGVNSPMPTILTKDRLALVQPKPFIISAGGPEGQGRTPKGTEDPLGTVMAQDHKCLVEPIIIPVNHGKGDTRSHSIQKPMPTLTTVDAWAMIQPYLIKYYGTKQDPKALDYPVETITAKDRFGLVEPRARMVKGKKGRSKKGKRKGKKQEIHGYFIFDVLFRMLEPHELAAAMGFPKTYKLKGTREDKVKMIGNAVEVHVGKALIFAQLQDICEFPEDRVRSLRRLRRMAN